MKNLSQLIWITVLSTLSFSVVFRSIKTSMVTMVLKSAQIKSNSTIYQTNCTGRPHERRLLASFGSSATDEQWEQMGACIARREKTLTGIYALHVSKAGGTSLCNLFKSEKCFIPPVHKPEANCFASSFQSSTIDFSTQWVRKQINREHNNVLPRWMQYDERKVPSSSCEDIKDYMAKWKQQVAMSENWLPRGGKLCYNDFSNVIAFREPISRILSHYQHLYKKCIRKNSKEKIIPCQKMLEHNQSTETGERYFNVTYMIDWFDIISDNYYLRSLNDQNVYQQENVLKENINSDKFFSNALENLHNFDWVILIQSGNADEKTNTQLIIENGLGLDHRHYFKSNSRKVKDPEIYRIKFNPRDHEDLLQRNQLDLQLWEEVKKLHALDVSSLKKLSMKRKWRASIKKNKDAGRCCGVICERFSNS